MVRNSVQGCSFQWLWGRDRDRVRDWDRDRLYTGSENELMSERWNVSDKHLSCPEAEYLTLVPASCGDERHVTQLT